MLPLPLPFFPAPTLPHRDYQTTLGTIRVVAHSPTSLRLLVEERPTLLVYKRVTYQLWATLEKDIPGRHGWTITMFDLMRAKPRANGSVRPTDEHQIQLRRHLFGLAERAEQDADFVREAEDAAIKTACHEVILQLGEHHRSLIRIDHLYRTCLAAALALIAPNHGGSEYAAATEHLDGLEQRVFDAWDKLDSHLLPAEDDVMGLVAEPLLRALGEVRRRTEGQPEELLLRAAEADLSCRVLDLHRGHAAIAAWLAQQEAERGPLGEEEDEA